MKCPACNLDEAVWVDIIKLQPLFGAHHKLAWEYIEKFSVAPITRNSKKTLRLLQEVAALFAQKKFIWKKAEYEISEKGIVEGLRIVCNADLVTPLKDHNYLRAVLAGIADKERTESRSALDKDLKRREDRRQYTVDSRKPEQNKSEAVLTAEENARRAKELVDKIGARS